MLLEQFLADRIILAAAVVSTISVIVLIAGTW
jgi:hypothetical protein